MSKTLDVLTCDIVSFGMIKFNVTGKCFVYCAQRTHTNMGPLDRKILRSGGILDWY